MTQLRPSHTPPEAWEPLLRLARFAGRPLERFMRIEAASGILLLATTAVALVWANSSWAESYTRLWDLRLGVQLGPYAFERPLLWAVNDGLMVIFFFLVGLEIRRELHHGELAEWRRAALPVAAAIGGMIGPALIYLALSGAGASRLGWGVPMATDIAFAVGVLTLLGKRVPPALRVLLLALAVIDDLGAIVVIALFYSAGISPVGVLVAALGLGGIFVLRGLGVRRPWAYVVPGVVVWAGTYAAGVHPTIAGVIIGLITPVRAWLGPEGFVRGTRAELERLAGNIADQSAHELAETLRHVDDARREVMSPAESLIEALHRIVAFAIMPIFALANAGVVLGGLGLDAAATRTVLGCALGLLVGKPVGILLASGLVLRLRVAVLPRGLGARHLLALGVVAGVGFTMALFIAQLAFAAQPQLLAAAKLGVLGASGAAVLLALGVGLWVLRPSLEAARSADEAESSGEP